MISPARNSMPRQKGRDVDIPVSRAMNAAAQFPAQHRFVHNSGATGQWGNAVFRLAKLYMPSYLLESAGMSKVIRNFAGTTNRPEKLKSKRFNI